MEAGHRDNAAKAENSERDRYPDLQGWGGAENRECYPESPAWEEVRRISYSEAGISYKQIGKGLEK